MFTVFTQIHGLTYFNQIEVTDEEESIPDIFVWRNHNEPHKKFKLVSKFAIKPTELETAVPKKTEK